MAWLVVSGLYVVAKIEVMEVMVLCSVDIVVFSVDLDRVLIEGYTMRNEVFLGLSIFLKYI